MVLDDISNNEFEFGRPLNFKRRRLNNRRHSLIPLPNNKSMIYLQYRQIEGPELPKGQSRRYSYAPIREKSIDTPIKSKRTQPVNTLNLEKLRQEYSDVKTKYLALEKSINELKSAHELEAELAKDDFLLRKNEMKKTFNDKLKEIEGDYFNRVKKIVEENSIKSENEINVLKGEIEDIKSKINHISRFAFKETKVQLQLDHEGTINSLRISHDNEVQKLKKKETKYQKWIEELNRSIESYTKNKLNTLGNKEEKLSVLIDKALIDQKVLHSNELNHLTEIEMIESNLKLERNDINKLKDKVKTLLLEKNDFDNLVLEEQTKRRMLHNKLQELKGNIRVFCRLKPCEDSKTFSIEKKGYLETMNDKESLTIKEIPRKNGMPSSPTKSKSNSYKFEFDAIFDQNSDNEDVFKEISQLVQSALDGFNVCIFTYGQTGSGKTYTMSNPEDGLIPRSLTQIFRRMETLQSLGFTYELHGQFFEIYGDSINDLLSKNKSTGSDINHIEKIELHEIDHVNLILSKANMKRSTAPTNSNNESSRSHSIFRFSINGKDKDGVEFNSVLNLIDLAGSERISSSQVKGIRLKETQVINKSLSALGDVINALSLKSSHVPYRNSKLTYLLKESLGGDSKMLMFVNISCLKEHFNESLNSLRFASKVNNTKIAQ